MYFAHHLPKLYTHIYITSKTNGKKSVYFQKTVFFFRSFLVQIVECHFSCKIKYKIQFLPSFPLQHPFFSYTHCLLNNLFNFFFVPNIANNESQENRNGPQQTTRLQIEKQV